MNNTTDKAMEMLNELAREAAEKQAEQRAFVISYMDWDGENFNEITRQERWELFCLGNGFGNRTPDEEWQISRGYNWSRTLDSSPLAFERMAARLKSILAERQRQRAFAAAAETRSRLIRTLQTAQTAFLDNPSAESFVRVQKAMLEYQDFDKNS